MSPNYNLPPVILASNSPRRKDILLQAGVKFIVKSKNIEEKYSLHLKREQVPVFLSKIKGEAFLNEVTDEIVIAADTVVVLNDEILGKPADKEDAIKILTRLSGQKHEVITGVTIIHKGEIISFYDITSVYFSKLKKTDIEYYVNEFKPYDKAGAYGIQEYIGLVGIERIDGSYYNVMGLPVHLVLQHLQNYNKI